MYSLAVKDMFEYGYYADPPSKKYMFCIEDVNGPVCEFDTLYDSDDERYYEIHDHLTHMVDIMNNTASRKHIIVYGEHDKGFFVKLTLRDIVSLGLPLLQCMSAEYGSVRCFVAEYGYEYLLTYQRKYYLLTVKEVLNLCSPSDVIALFGYALKPDVFSDETLIAIRDFNRKTQQFLLGHDNDMVWNTVRDMLKMIDSPKKL